LAWYLSCWIKRVVIHHNLSIDLQTAKSKSSVYSFLFLGSLSPYIGDFKKYTINKLFKNSGLFISANARKRFVKALLTTNPFPQLCKFCQEHFRELLHHQLCGCRKLKHQRQTLQMELRLYTKFGMQPITTLELKEIISLVIHDKLLLRCFTNFLQAVDF